QSGDCVHRHRRRICGPPSRHVEARGGQRQNSLSYNRAASCLNLPRALKLVKMKRANVLDCSPEEVERARVRTRRGPLQEFMINPKIARLESYSIEFAGIVQQRIIAARANSFDYLRNARHNLRVRVEPARSNPVEDRIRSAGTV